MASGITPTKDVIYLARTDFRNKNQLFGIRRKDRRQHMYVMGKSGTGKSALLHNLAVQDIVNNDGLCVVDPHGELVESLIKKIPRERLGDVIYFNPADPDYHVGFNPLELPDPKYKHLVASGLMSIFTKIWANVWSARMEYIMNNAILALLDSPGSTMLGINRILVDKDFRQKIISQVKDPVVKAFWINEFESWKDQFRNEAIAPIQNKVGQFLSTSLIRNIVGQSKSTIDIFSIMNERKILLVDLSKGRIGEDNSALLGAMLITKIQLAAMERVRVPEEERADFYLYVDEFQNFATDSFAGILSEARKYRLDLILAHQYIGQLVTDVSTKVRDAVFGNVGTMIIFRVGASDAEFLENEFSPEVAIEDIVNLPNYRIYLKLLVDGIASRPFSGSTLPPFNVPVEAASPDELVKNSRKLYSRPRKKIEDEITSWSSSMGSDEYSGERDEKKPKKESGKYSGICDSCGKNTTVHFKPTPGKPLYCDDCFAKIKASAVKPGSEEAIPKDVHHLADLGIEFERENKISVPERTSSKSSLRQTGFKAAISLGDLKTDSSKKESDKSKSRNSRDVEGLRQALKEALAKENQEN